MPRFLLNERQQMRWSEFVATLNEEEHRPLIMAVSTGLHESRLAADVLRDNGDVDELRWRIDAAFGWLEDARRLLSGTE
jgi:hypothetical protein